jgi:hypothetical protein
MEVGDGDSVSKGCDGLPEKGVTKRVGRKVRVFRTVKTVAQRVIESDGSRSGDPMTATTTGEIVRRFEFNKDGSLNKNYYDFVRPVRVRGVLLAERSECLTPFPFSNDRRKPRPMAPFLTPSGKCEGVRQRHQSANPKNENDNDEITDKDDVEEQSLTCYPEKQLSPKQSLWSLYQTHLYPRKLKFALALSFYMLYFVVPHSMIREDSYWQHQADLRAIRKQEIPSGMRITAVVMNHGRPKLLRETSTLLPTLLNHPRVDQVLLLHSNHATQFNYTHPKLTNIDAIQANAQVGLAIRFQYCASHARNAHVLLVDDDMEFSAHAVDDVLRAAIQYPKRIVGHDGRAYHWWTTPLQQGYHTYNVRGHAEVVLTKFLLLPKPICQAFMDYSYLMQDLLPRSKPLWNGEDIFVNLVANHVFNVSADGPFNNFAMQDLDVWPAVVEEGDRRASISGNLGEMRPWNTNLLQFLEAFRKSQLHFAYRGQLWGLAKARLAALPAGYPRVDWMVPP